jgi:flagellin
MSLTINTNVDALYAQTAIANNNVNQSQAMEQLSTGLQINQASDNAAGLAVSQAMTEQINGMGQAIANANDSINMLQTADSAMSTQQQMLQTMFTLATQAANGTYSSTQRTYMNNEFTQLANQITNIATQTTWNGMKLLTGTTAASGGIGTFSSGKVQFQMGVGSGQTISVKIPAITLHGLSISGANVNTVSSASSAITSINTALETLNSTRSTVGATVNQLTYAAQDLTSVQSNETTSRAAITDTNYAQASTNLSRSQIIAQAATAMLAQANQESQNVLTLLKGG